MTFLLAKPYDASKHDPTGWWMSEKLDGMRAQWDPEHRILASRLGNVIHAPQWWLDGLPDMHLDGELFMGRGRFQETMSVCRRSAAGMQADRWTDVQFMAFDCEMLSGEPFEERMFRLTGTDLAGSQFRSWKPVSQVRCEDRAHLAARMKHVLEGGGEGMMLREPGSLYAPKRSGTLLKVKVFHDAEATVTGHIPGKGKHSGRLGALACVADSGAAFDIGTGFSDAQRESPPPVGSRVTYSYQELTNDGVPRFPVFIRVWQG